MHLTTNERRIHQSHEDAREREACGEEPEIACAECDDALDEEKAHTLEGITYCATCALHQGAVMFHMLDKLWAGRPAKERLECLEVIGAAANELEGQLRTAIRAGKAA